MTLIGYTMTSGSSGPIRAGTFTGAGITRTAVRQPVAATVTYTVARLLGAST